LADPEGGWRELLLELKDLVGTEGLQAFFVEVAARLDGVLPIYLRNHAAKW
jgi:hypothetical protein